MGTTNPEHMIAGQQSQHAGLQAQLPWYTMAECDIRMIKIKQKNSGAFRTQDSIDPLGAIRGYMSTVRKRGFDGVVVV